MIAAFEDFKRRFFDLPEQKSKDPEKNGAVSMRTWRLSLDTATASGIICTQGTCHRCTQQRRRSPYISESSMTKYPCTNADVQFSQQSCTSSDAQSADRESLRLWHAYRDTAKLSADQQGDEGDDEVAFQLAAPLQAKTRYDLRNSIRYTIR